MEKEGFFSKLNITNYNNELEDILEKKSFSEGAKNILLNILYKIETAYDDYSKVKVETDLKKDILEELIKIISKRCKEIEIIKPKIDEKTVLGDEKFLIEKNKIISYPNERNLYFGLLNLKKDNFKVSKEYAMFQKPLENLLNMGYITDLEEIIRDFDGWAWNILTEDIENYTYNLVYQNIKMLVGSKFIHESILNMNRINFIDRLEKKIDNMYSEEISTKLKDAIYVISILEYIKEDNERKENLIKEKELLEEELEKINNKKEYLQNLANKKKEIAKKIRPIDEMLNNNRLLRDNFKKENEALSEEEKIFSLSEYVEKLQERRKDLLKDLKRFGNLMKPMNYVKNKYNMQRKFDLLNKIDFSKNLEEQKYVAIINLQINFLKALQEKIGKQEIKKKIIEYIYIFRYYKLLYFTKETQIKDIEELKEHLEMAEKYLITRACNLKLINIFSHNIEKNYEIVSKILETKIIDLDEMNIEFTKQDGKIILNIFDDNMIDKSIEYDENEDINIKQGKKIKLFI